MMKKMIALLMVLVLALAVTPGFAEENAKARENALAAAKVSLPDAVVDYTVRERDDGRYEWNLFFTQGTQLGVCKVREDNNEIRRVELFTKPEGGLTASEAMAKLMEKKGQAEIVELELDWERNVLTYEGEADLGGKRYEFEMSVLGEILQWERD